MSKGPGPRKLLQIEEVAELLHLDVEQLRWLINTDQIQPIRICGQDRFDSDDIYRLIDTYKTTQARGNNDE